MGLIGDIERRHKARKSHTCDQCHKEIAPGSWYSVGITFPGSASYPIGGGDYEPIDWEFTALKLCDPCLDRRCGYGDYYEDY